MKNKIVLLIIALAVFTGCVNNKKEENKTSDLQEETIVEKKVIQNIPNRISEKNDSPKDCGLNFESFFTRFSTDSAFQKNRIQFPLKMSTMDAYDSENPSIENLSLKDYSFIDFSNDKDAINRDTDKYKVEIVENKETTIYKKLGIDNGIYVEFKFEKQENCWLLISIEDQSN
ncbi:hypothetical protein IWQ47_002343 [Aquimarina sp. EL_43]|uniref:DUF4348 domain-containing protein n=1 Tax=unclassified Aquimarina TaxID=2627091 RepID=UPI0018C9E495|nr:MULTISPECIES: DUF4348 domain-containing protein [unclassified Aquimarina]MBG6130873.1 hypothetical protein [Aquimarina sp. EL_35]MBG6151332.1 hypothetical protein [Aquimarina sp. EL_32]MBG6169263.1 hypothetical protein [Aquimarina sp. EL_43]